MFDAHFITRDCLCDRTHCVCKCVHVRKFKIEIACYNQYEYRTIVLNGGRVFLSEPGTKREPRAHICSSSCEACTGICYAVRVFNNNNKKPSDKRIRRFCVHPIGALVLSAMRCVSHGIAHIAHEDDDNNDIPFHSTATKYTHTRTTIACAREEADMLRCCLRNEEARRV